LIRPLFTDDFEEPEESGQAQPEDVEQEGTEVTEAVGGHLNQRDEWDKATVRPLRTFDTRKPIKWPKLWFDPFTQAHKMAKAMV
jgi:hypothetical protein